MYSTIMISNRVFHVDLHPNLRDADHRANILQQIRRVRMRRIRKTVLMVKTLAVYALLQMRTGRQR